MASLALPQLFVKSRNSLFESTISAEEIINFHLKNKHRYAILTESQKVRYFPSFHYLACQKNLIPVLSLHYIWKNISEWLFIPKNYEGYKFLLRFTSDNLQEKPRWEDVVKIFLSGSQVDKPWEGEDFFIANSEKERGVFVRENLFLLQADYAFYSLLSAIKSQTEYNKELELKVHLKNSYLIQGNDDNKLWKKNLVSILKKCEKYSLKLEASAFFGLQKREEIINYCQERLKEYIFKFQEFKKQKYLERFCAEIKLFDNKKYWNYCFIFYELMKFIHNEKILTSAGRGSACSSLIIFLLGITQVDPLKYDLLFDRFLNEFSDRIPDLDLDIEGERRRKVLLFLKDKFGEGRFAIPSIIKKIKNIEVISPLLEKVATLETLKKFNLFDKLIGVPFSFQPHPSSLIVLPENMEINHLSAQKEDNFIFPISPFEYGIVSYLGLQKFDLLSSPYLDFISSCLSKINEVKLQNICLKDIPLDDEKTYEMIGRALTYGLFHLDSNAIKKVLENFHPKSIEELAQLISVIRPGINKHILKFLNYLNIAPNSCSDEILKSITCSTRGIILYQEQIMQLVSSYINIPLAESDRYRIALQKQDEKMIERLKLEFFELAKRAGKKYYQIGKVWRFMESFGAYSFNKSHAIAYALSAYQAAYLKANFLEVFYLEISKKDGMSDTILSELLSFEYELVVPEKIEDWTIQGSFDCDRKIFYIGLNCLTRNSENIFNKIQKIKKKMKTETAQSLNMIVFALLSNGFSVEDIMHLNYLNAFKHYFASGQTDLYLKFNWNYLFKTLIYDFASIESERTVFSREEYADFQKERQEYLRINLKKFKLN